MTDPRPKTPRDRPQPMQWLRGLLRRPLRLERRGLQIHVVLGAPPDGAAQAAPPPGAGATLRRGHEELRALLRRHPEVRHLMRHLGFVEQALARSGSGALSREVPVPVLRKALEQLELLARDEPSEGLTLLRQRIADAVRGRADASAARGIDAVQVSEASVSLFEEMERSWTGRMPLLPASPPDAG